MRMLCRAEHDRHVVRHEYFQGGTESRFGKGMRIHPGKDRSVDALSRPVLAKRLGVEQLEDFLQRAMVE